MTISAELKNGISRYQDDAERIGYGTHVTVTMPAGTERIGEFVELGFGGCQPGIRTADGKRYRIPNSEFRRLVAATEKED